MCSPGTEAVMPHPQDDATTGGEALLGAADGVLKRLTLPLLTPGDVLLNGLWRTAMLGLEGLGLNPPGHARQKGLLALTGSVSSSPPILLHQADRRGAGAAALRAEERIVPVPVADPRPVIVAGDLPRTMYIQCKPWPNSSSRAKKRGPEEEVAQSGAQDRFAPAASRGAPSSDGPDRRACLAHLAAVETALELVAAAPQKQ